jgi:hypothetical protein
MPPVEFKPFSWERVWQAVERVKDRCRRVAAALEAGGVPYAVVGGNAVAAWVARVDAAAERFTADVDILLRRADLAAAIAATASAGFVHRSVNGVDLLADGPDAGPRDAVHIVFAGEKVDPRYVAAAPDVTESEPGPQFRIVTLEALVRMKLTSFRARDQVHIRDMIGVGIIDANWPARFAPPLAERLQSVLDTPEG